MEVVVERTNLLAALKRVERNKVETTASKRRISTVLAAIGTDAVDVVEHTPRCGARGDRRPAFPQACHHHDGSNDAPRDALGLAFVDEEEPGLVAGRRAVVRARAG